jgi:hypothetical protein
VVRGAGINDAGEDDDPYGATGPATVLAYLRGRQPMAAE